jgi:hypothetical protein
MGTKLYNKMPGYLKGMDSYEAFKKELKSCLSGGICIFIIDNV